MPDLNSNENLVVARFFMHPMLNEAATKKAGRPIYTEIEACEVRMAANKLSRGVFPAHDTIRMIDDPITGERTPLTYAMAYNAQYLAFKRGEAQVQSGTPLSELPFLTAAKRLELKALSIHTAEALAALDGAALKQLGMGGRELKNQAQAYLDKAAGSADVTGMAATIAAQADMMAEMQKQIAELTTVAKPAAAKPASASPFDQMEDIDIKNWIKEQTGAKPQGNPAHATLVAMADEINADLAAKAKAKEAA